MRNLRVSNSQDIQVGVIHEVIKWFLEDFHPLGVIKVRGLAGEEHQHTSKTANRSNFGG